MKLYSFFGIVIILTLCISTNLSIQQNAEELYQSALYKEEVEGDLVNAIAIYEKIIKEFPSNEPVAAKALYHVGLCYEKLGNQKAQNAFQKVIEDYPGQKDIVKLAKEKLSLLQKALIPVSKEDEGISIRKLWDGVTWGSPSPDGHYFAFHHAETGDLAIREIASGNIRRLNLKKTYKESLAMAMTACWSADGKVIAYGWVNSAGDKNKNSMELRLVNFDGSNVRILCGVKGYITPTAWSADGKHILVWLAVGPHQMALVKVSDGSIKTIQPWDRGERSWWPIWQFLPGDEYVIFSDQQGDKSDNKDIFLYSIAEDKKVALLQNPANDYLLGILPEGEWVFFGSDRSGKPDLWGIRVKEGKVQGQPVLIKSQISDVATFGVTQAGQLFYSVWIMMKDIYLTKLDLDQNKILEKPQKVTEHFTGSNFSPAWSPDGKYLAFGSARSAAQNSRALCIMSHETRELVEHYPKIKGFMQLSFMFWSPDSSAVIYNSHDKEVAYGFFKNDIRSGKFVRKSYITENRASSRILGSALSLDGKVVYYSQRNSKGPWHLIEFNLEKSSSKVLHEGLQIGSMSLSPNGQNLAFVALESTEEEPDLISIQVAPVTNFNKSNMRTLVESKVNISSLVWSPDGQKIIFAKNDKPTKQGKYYTLYQIPAMGGTPLRIGLSLLDIAHLSIHPDGQRVAFGTGSLKQELWVMENIIPKEK